jgi:hypothetical protein
MFSINFELSNLSADPANPRGFDLGDTEFVGDCGSCTSKGRTPNQSHMIFLSTVLLLDDLKSFLEGDERQFEFGTIDSSFQVLFTREPDSRIRVTCYDKLIHLSDKESLKKDVYNSVSKFMDEVGILLPEDDPVYSDIWSALKNF